MSLASATPKVIVDALTLMSAGVGILQAMEIAKAWKKIEVGTAKERRDAIFNFFSADLGVVKVVRIGVAACPGSKMDQASLDALTISGYVESG